MGRTARTEPQCLYKGALYLYLRVELYLYSPYGPYGLYRASVPVQGCTLPFPPDEATEQRMYGVKKRGSNRVTEKLHRAWHHAPNSEAVTANKSDKTVRHVTQVTETRNAHKFSVGMNKGNRPLGILSRIQ